VGLKGVRTVYRQHLDIVAGVSDGRYPGQASGPFPLLAVLAFVLDLLSGFSL